VIKNQERDGGEERCIQDYGGKLGRRRHIWKIILNLIFKQWFGGMDWIGLAQDRERWRVLVNVVMNLRVP
jgi:hypothetical protein